MENKLEKKYGLWTAMCMVVGVVIGSGVFFKAEAVLNKTGGNMPLGILAWLIVGLVMIVCAYVFAVMATRYEKVNGIVDYAEATVGDRYAYNMGWFSATIHIPSLVSAVGWIAARYFCVLMGWDITGGACMTIAATFIALDYGMNALAPRMAGKFQVSATVIKLIPLALMAVVGTIAGLKSGLLMENFATASMTGEGGAMAGLMASCVAVAFAYEGWVMATSINAELKDAKRNLPLALVGGAFIVVIVYILYYIGLSGAVTTQELMASGQEAAKMAFQRVFGGFAGTLLFVLIVISCLGTLNGLILGCCRGMYSLAARGQGPNPKMFQQVDPVTNIPTNSAVVSLMINMLWLLYFYGANLAADGGWFGVFNFDSSELPVITLYGMFIPMFIQLMRKEKDLSTFKRVVMPVLGVLCCVFMIYAAFKAYGIVTCGCYLVIYVVIMVIGNFFYKKKAA